MPAALEKCSFEHGTANPQLGGDTSTTSRKSAEEATVQT